MCSEASPRVSFSHDLEGGVPGRDAKLLEDMNSDFEFNIGSSSEKESCCSSADELFSNGFILPIQFHHQNTSKHAAPPPPPPTVVYSLLPPLPRPSNENTKKHFQIVEQVNNTNNLKDLEEKEEEEEEEEKPCESKKSFWGFKRSSSLNYDVKKSSIRSSISIFSRSNSTGSVHNKDNLQNNKHPPRSHQNLQASSSSSSSSSSTGHPYQLLQQKKKNYVNGGGGVKVSPVLNLPPPYISKGTANLFGFG